MKKLLLFIIITVVIGVSGYLAFQILNTKAGLEESDRTKQSINWFKDFIQLDTTLHLSSETPAVLIFFNPDCDFCQHEAQAFHDHKELLKGVQWFWISESDSKSIDQFYEKFRLHQINDLYLIKDSIGLLTEKAGISTIPQILIYNQKGRLVQEFKGETKIEAIRNVLESRM